MKYPTSSKPPIETLAAEFITTYTADHAHTSDNLHKKCR
jgi:hypothetical protein